MRDARGAGSYGVMLMVAVLLHATFAFFISRPVHVTSAEPPVGPQTFTLIDVHNAPGPVDPSYPPSVTKVLPPAEPTGPGGPGQGPASDLQAKVNLNGLVTDASDGGNALVFGTKSASLESLLAQPVTGGPGTGQPGVGWRARADVPTVPFYKVEVKPRIVDVPVPAYPEAVRNAGIEGTATIQLLLDLDGSVMDARVLNSSGSQMLDAAAVEAAMKARFTPAMQQDKPVRVWISFPYRFRLTE
jgi:protein TonB